MARVQGQRLTVVHCGQIAERQTELEPVREALAIAAVGDQFLRELGHLRVQVVQDHEHNRGRLSALCANRVDWWGL